MTGNPDKQAEMTPLEDLARLAATIYHCFAAEAIETLGEKQGTEMIARAIRKMGEERGRRIRAKSRPPDSSRRWRT